MVIAHYNGSIAPANLKDSFDYTYRADNKRIGLTESIKTTTNVNNTYVWSYDEAGRLLSEALTSSTTSLTQTESYEYDLVGNRLKKTIDKPSTAYVDQVFAYGFDTNDRMTSETLDNGSNGVGVDQTTTFTWNATQQATKTQVIVGTSTVTQSVTYNLQGQASSVVLETKNGSNVVTGRTRVDYQYRPECLRTVSIDWNDANLDGTFAAGEKTGTTEYLVEPNNFTGYGQTLVETTKNYSGVITKQIRYTFGGDEITQTTVTYTGGVATGSTTRTFGHDGRGSVRVLYEAAAAIVQAFVFSAYGELLSVHNGAGNLQSLTTALTSILYNGEQIDTATGNYNFRARWYNPQTGRFEKLDPFAGNASDPFSFHKYGMAHGDTVNGQDPTGMFLGGIAGMMSSMMTVMKTQGMNVARSYVGKQAALTGIETGAEVLVGLMLQVAFGVKFDLDEGIGAFSGQ